MQTNVHADLAAMQWQQMCIGSAAAVPFSLQDICKWSILVPLELDLLHVLHSDPKNILGDVVDAVCKYYDVSSVPTSLCCPSEAVNPAVEL